MRFLFLVLMMFSCASGFSLPKDNHRLESARTSFAKNKDYKSLKIIFSHLKKGLAKSEVDRLLGEPVYSPIEGQYYYLSEDKEQKIPGSEMKAPVGIVVSYQKTDPTKATSVISDRLETFFIGPIGE